MEECYEIIPGESIGPFRLGMTREEVEKLNIHPMQIFEDISVAEFTTVGVTVKYDLAGKCKRIDARLQVYGFEKGTARFVLAGRSVNNISEREAKELFLSISSEISFRYGAFDLPSVGLQATKWENSDDDIYDISVMPPHEHKT